MADAGAMQGRNEMDVGEVDEQQAPLQFGLHVVTLGRLHAIPLVQGDDQGTAGLEDEAEQVEVVLDHPFAGVHDEDHHVGVLDRLEGLHHRELFHRLEDLAAAPHASGVDQGVLLLVALERDVDAVAGGAGLVVDDHPLFAEHAVDQGRLAHVGPADDGDLDPVLLAGTGNPGRFLAFGDLFARRLALAFFLRVVLGEDPQGFLQHMVDAATVGGGDRQRIAQAQRAELGASEIGIDGVDLVGDQEAALVPLAQVLGDHLVGGGHAGARIDQEQDGIRLLDGLQRLLGHFRIDAFLIAGDASGIDDDIGAALPARLAVLAIAGQACVLRHDGVARLGQAVEQSGLADVRATHQGNNGNHAALHENSENTKAADVGRQRPDT